MQNNVSFVPISFYKDHKYFRHIIEALTDPQIDNDLLAYHAAVLVKGHSIIATGVNKSKTSGLVRAYAPHDRMTIHAEIDCLLKARKKHDLRGTTIYVGRKLKKFETLSMSKPCETCHTLLQQYGVRHAYYTDASGKISYIDISQKYIKNKTWHIERT